MKRNILLFLFLLSLLPAVGKEWKAWWISTDVCQSEPNTWLSYRKTVEIEKVPDTALAAIAADSKYWLWINDHLVVFEGGLKRGPNPADTYYDEVDIAPYLKKGKNIIAVLVWYFGKQGFSHNSSGKAALLFDCQTPEVEIISDHSWRCMIHPAYGTAPDPKPNYRLSESSLLFDARRDPEGWYRPGFNEHSIPGASALQKAGEAPWNQLVKRPTPLWKDSGLKEYEKVYRNGDTLVCELPYNAQVTPYLKVESPAGKKVVIATDNYFYYNGNTENIRSEYITREGIQEYESYGWMNGHKVYYLLPGEVKVLSLLYRETGYDTEFSGSFTSSDPLFNQLWEKSARTLYVTMRDTYMDCPERERAQWAGDAVNQAGEAFYALSLSSHLLTRKWIHELIGWQKQDGVIYAPVPAGNWYTELPGQTLAALGYYGIWNYYMHTGDKETLVAVYPAVKKYLDLWTTDAQGLVRFREVGWLWGDWGDNRDMHPLINAWYYLALQGAFYMATELENEADALEYVKRMTRLKVGFNSCFWTGNAYRDPHYRGETDDRVQALAVVSGLADTDKYRKLQTLFRTQLHASTYMEKYVFEAMMKMGLEEEAMQRHRRRMEGMVTYLGFSTLYEHWNIGVDGFKGGSVNHSWTGGGLTVLSQYVCGVSPLKPGYESVAVLPQPGDLKKASAVVPSVKGRIETSFVNEKDLFTLQVTLPPDTKGVIGVPGKRVKEITVNGHTVWKKGKFVENPVCRFSEERGETHVKFEVSSGNYQVMALK